jgi:hypothetical protein
MKPMTRIHSLPLAILASLALASLAGCGPSYDHTDITAVNPTVIGGGIQKTQVQIPEGLIISAHIDSKNTDQKPMGLVVRSQDSSIVEIQGIVTDHDFAFLGVRAGHTAIDIVADDKVVLTIPADVTPQPSP